MKITALILVYYFSFLSALPFVTLMESTFSEQTKEYCEKNCCENEKETEKTEKNKQSGICNPFQSCASCYICYLSQTTFEPLNLEFTKVTLPTTTNHLISTFCSNWFHPPDIV